MENISLLLKNEILISSILAWAVAQVIKTVINIFEVRKFDPERLVGAGGMPSSHSATVCSLVTAVGMRYGLDTYEFAMAAVLAIIVMYDAINVRQEAGKHAKWINIINATMDPNIRIDKKFKEYLGHTPFQVIVGGIIGIVIAVLVYQY